MTPIPGIMWDIIEVLTRATTKSLQIALWEGQKAIGKFDFNSSQDDKYSWREDLRQVIH